MLLHMLQCFEGIHLSRQFLAIAIAAIGMEHEGIAGGELPGRPLTITQEVEFGEGFSASVEPEVETMRMRTGALEAGRHHQSVGLHAAVEP